MQAVPSFSPWSRLHWEGRRTASQVPSPRRARRTSAICRSRSRERKRELCISPQLPTSIPWYTKTAGQGRRAPASCSRWASTWAKKKGSRSGARPCRS